MNRRHFLMGAAGALGATQVKSHLLGSPNDTIRVACVGVRGQGNSHLKEYGKMKNVEIAAICDIDETILNQRLGEVEAASGKRPMGYWNIRKLLEDQSIDAHLHRHTEPQPHAADHLVSPGGQTRLLREAVLA